MHSCYQALVGLVPHGIGRHCSLAVKLLASIRRKLGKGRLITVQEFSACTGIGEETIRPFLPLVY